MVAPFTSSVLFFPFYINVSWLYLPKIFNFPEFIFVYISCIRSCINVLFSPLINLLIHFIQKKRKMFNYMLEVLFHSLLIFLIYLESQIRNLSFHVVNFIFQELEAGILSLPLCSLPKKLLTHLFLFFLHVKAHKEKSTGPAVHFFYSTFQISYPPSHFFPPSLSPEAGAAIFLRGKRRNELFCLQTLVTKCRCRNLVL